MDDAGAVHEGDCGHDLREEEADPDVVHLVEELLEQVVAQGLAEDALHHVDCALAARVQKGGEQSGGEEDIQGKRYVDILDLFGPEKIYTRYKEII